MRVLLKFEIDCTPDAAWRALRSPAGLREVSTPLMTFTSLEPRGFPTVWSEGGHPLAVKALGLLPVGEQLIDISFTERKGARIVQDFGGALSGPLSLVTRWEHSMAVAPAPGGRTLYRDQLVFSAGPVTAAVWPALWSFWQWRGAGIRRLAPTWE